MRNTIKVLFGAALFVAATMISGPSVKACPGGGGQAEIDRNYFNADGCWQAERLTYCDCSHADVGDIAGAKWIHIESFPCGNGSVNSEWYVWDATSSSYVPTTDPGLSGC